MKEIDEPLKVLVPAEGPDLTSEVGNRFGTSPYLLIVDPKTMLIEALPNPGVSGQKGAGMQAVALTIGKTVDVVLTGYCSPTAEKYLTASGIEVIKGVRGTVADAVDRYRKGKLVFQAPETGKSRGRGMALPDALAHALRQFARILPMIGGVILLIGLFNAFVPRAFLRSFFRGGRGMDTLLGACLGSFFAGNPINSYIIGGELLKQGVSLFGVTAFMVAWVSVGWVQLPAEMGALGGRFAIARNVLSFIMAIVVALLTVVVLGFLTRGTY